MGTSAPSETKGSGNQVGRAAWNQRAFEEKKAAVDEEISRMNKLPANSTYAAHRLRVSNKILHLLSIQVFTHNFLSFPKPLVQFFFFFL